MRSLQAAIAEAIEDDAGALIKIEPSNYMLEVLAALREISEDIKALEQRVSDIEVFLVLK